MASLRPFSPVAISGNENRKAYTKYAVSEVLMSFFQFLLLKKRMLIPTVLSPFFITLETTKKLNVVHKQGHNSGSP